MAQCGIKRVLPVKEALNEGKMQQAKALLEEPCGGMLIGGRTNDRLKEVR